MDRREACGVVTHNEWAAAGYDRLHELWTIARAAVFDALTAQEQEEGRFEHSILDQMELKASEMIRHREERILEARQIVSAYALTEAELVPHRVEFEDED